VEGLKTLLGENSDIAIAAGVVLLLVSGLIVLWKKWRRADETMVVDKETQHEAKARLGILTGIEILDSTPEEVQEDLQEAMPKSQPPVQIAGTTSGSQSSGREQAVLTQYTSGDGQGIAEMEKMLDKDPNNPQLIDWIAFMYYSNDQPEKAIGWYRQGIGLDPNNASQHYYLANSYYKANRLSEALTHWRKVCELKPDGKLARKAGTRIKKAEAALS
jgi:tetratricopeptide (TPR) repeat protein